MFSLAAEDLERIEFRQLVGDVRIVAQASPGLATFRGSKVDWSDTACTFIAEQNDRAVRVGVERMPGPGATCMVHWELMLPAAAELDLKVGQGVVSVSGQSGPMKADVGNGDLSLDGITGPVDVRIGQGQLSGTAHPSTLLIELGQGGVHLDGLIRPVIVEAGTANIELAWIVAPLGDTSVRIGSGAIDLTLPDGTGIEAKTRGVGKKRVELAQVPGAGVRLEAVVGMGRIRIHGPSTDKAPKGEGL
jgi:hypothetical protein